MEKKVTLVHCGWECRLVQTLWKTVWNFLRKLKMELPFDPAIDPKNPETPIQKNLCTPMFIAAQFTIAKYCKQPKCPSANEWIQKLWYIYLILFYAAERKRELIPFATAWMKLERTVILIHLFISYFSCHCHYLKSSILYFIPMTVSFSLRPPIYSFHEIYLEKLHPFKSIF